MESRRITVRGIAFDDGKLLAVKHKTNKGIEAEYWSIPGGGLDLGESLHDGLIREMIEETGITPKVGKLLFIQQYTENQREFLELFFEISNPREYRNINLDATTHGAIELTHCAYITPSQENLLPKFLRTIDIGAYINEDQAPYIANYL